MMAVSLGLVLTASLAPALQVEFSFAFCVLLLPFIAFILLIFPISIFFPVLIFQFFLLFLFQFFIESIFRFFPFQVVDFIHIISFVSHNQPFVFRTISVVAHKVTSILLFFPSIYFTILIKLFIAFRLQPVQLFVFLIILVSI